MSLTRQKSPNVAKRSLGDVTGNEIAADVAATEAGTSFVHLKNAWVASGVAVTVAVWPKETHCTDGKTEPPAFAVAATLYLTDNCHSRRRYAAGSGCV